MDIDAADDVERGLKLVAHTLVALIFLPLVVPAWLIGRIARVFGYR